MAKLITGDCVEEMAKLPENSVDAIVTDPPYGIGFMGKEWDGKAIKEAAEKDKETRKDLGPESSSRPGRKQPRSSSAYGSAAHYAGPVKGGNEFQQWCEQWAREAYRVLKPGGHLIAFGGTRTYHRMACAVEDAGFEIRDQIQWLYGSGFPKSHNVGKAIDKKRHDKKEIYQVTAWIREARNKAGITNKIINDAFGFAGEMAGHWTARKSQASVPTLDQVPKLLEVLGVKPEEVPKDIARLLLDLNGKKGQPGKNWFKREVVGKKTAGMGSGKTFGMLQSEGNNSEAKKELDITAPATEEAARWEGWGTALKPASEPCVLARKPFKGTVAENVQEWGTGAMNIDGCRVEGAPPSVPQPSFGSPTGQTYGMKTGEGRNGEMSQASGRWPANIILDKEAGELLDEQSGIKEGPARFFYCPKAGKKERNAGLDGFEEKIAVQRMNASKYRYEEGRKPTKRAAQSQNKNTHPTVKPIKLMAYLIRLVTPPGGTVLDPFLGSGSTGCAAIEEGFEFIGIEREQEYMDIAAARIAHWEKEQAAEQEQQADSDSEKAKK